MIVTMHIMIAGEVVFVSEPIFCGGPPQPIGPDIYCNGDITAIITDSDAIYAYAPNTIYNASGVLGGYMVFSCNGISGTLQRGWLCGRSYDVPINLCGSIAETMLNTYTGRGWGDCEYERLVDIWETADSVTLITCYHHSLVVIRLSYQA